MYISQLIFDMTGRLGGGGGGGGGSVCGWRSGRLRLWHRLGALTWTSVSSKHRVLMRRGVC